MWVWCTKSSRIADRLGTVFWRYDQIIRILNLVQEVKIAKCSFQKRFFYPMVPILKRAILDDAYLEEAPIEMRSPFGMRKRSVRFLKWWLELNLYFSDDLINRGASFWWSFGSLSAWGSKESTTILTTHPSLKVNINCKNHFSRTNLVLDRGKSEIRECTHASARPPKDFHTEMIFSLRRSAFIWLLK